MLMILNKFIKSLSRYNQSFDYEGLRVNISSLLIIFRINNNKNSKHKQTHMLMNRSLIHA